MMIMISILLVLVLHQQIKEVTAQNQNGQGTIADLELMFEKLEEDTVAFAREMEQMTLYANRCSADTLQQCTEGSYHACDSELPYAE